MVVELLVTGVPTADKSARMTQTHTRTMRFPARLATALATLTLVPLPADAKVVSQRQPSPSDFC